MRFKKIFKINIVDRKTIFRSSSIEQNKKELLGKTEKHVVDFVNPQHHTPSVAPLSVVYSASARPFWWLVYFIKANTHPPVDMWEWVRLQTRVSKTTRISHQIQEECASRNKLVKIKFDQRRAMRAQNEETPCVHAHGPQGGGQPSFIMWNAPQTDN